MPQLSLFIDLQNKQLVRGFNNNIQAALPEFFQGDTITLFLRFLNPTGNTAVPYADVDQSSAYVQAAIGTVGGLPTGGSFTLTDPDATQTTALIAYNADASTVQAAIRTGLTTNWSTATVSGNASGPWTVTNGVNAARSALVLVGTALTPASQGDVIMQQAGSGAAPAIQYFRLQLSPIAFQDSWTAYPAPTITIANVQTGGVSGSNSIQSVTLNNQPYNGTFTLSFGGQTTQPIAYNAQPSSIQTALQALSSIGSGNCAVGGAVGAYLITFIGTLGGAAQAAITASAGGLIGPLALIGTFSLATVGVEEAIGESPSISQTFEMNITPADGSAQTVLQVLVSILNDLIPNAPAIPTPTAVYLTEGQADARYFQISNNLSESTAATARTNLGLGTVATLAIDTDGTMAADSDTHVPSQKAVVTYVVAHAGGYAPYSKKTGNFTAVVGGVYGMDTTSGSITATPPASPNDGDWFSVFDLAKKWATNQAVIGSSGNNFIDTTHTTSTAGPYNLNAIPYVGQGMIRFAWDAALSVWSVN